MFYEYKNYKSQGLANVAPVLPDITPAKNLT